MTATAGVRTPGSGRVSSGRLARVAVAAAALAMIVTGALVPTARWVEWFEHPMRTLHRGGAIAATTEQGAVAWRVALVAGGAIGGVLGALLLRRRAGCKRLDDGAGAAPSQEPAPVPGAPPAPAIAEAPSKVAGRPAADRRRRDPVTRRGAAPALSADEGADEGAISGRDRLGIAALCALALALRIPRLGESLWYDEIASFMAFGQFGAGPTMGNYFTQSNHVLHGILTWIAVAIAGGVNEVVLRTPALLASIAAVPATWWLAREATGGGSAQRRAEACAEAPWGDGRAARGSTAPALVVPWVAATVAAAAPTWVLSVEARGYSLMILASAVATALFLRGRRLGRGVDRILYAVVIALGAWAHLVTITVALGHGLLVGIECLRRRAGALADAGALALAALLTLVLYAPILPDMLRIRSEFRALDGDEPTLLGPEGMHALLQAGGAWTWWAALPGLLLAIVGALSIGLRSRASARAPEASSLAQLALARRALLAALLGVPVAVGLAAIGGSWLYARFLLFALPGCALLMGFGAALLIRRRAALLAPLALVILGPWIADLLLRPAKQPLRDAVAEVSAHRAKEDRVVAIGLPDHVLGWYGILEGIEIVPTAPLGVDLESVLQRERPAWVIVLYPRSVAGDRFDLLARHGFELATRHRGWVDWDNGDVLVYRRRDDGAAASGRSSAP
ncbi:MAG TPA: hypothetical protein PKC43_02305 [Phycisphaerales bacterium]|nr:hypothetical protein [Phycisphaerales bacterium]HMP36257.1 hypothetical protein [Phycisphaerales bacterium]